MLTEIHMPSLCASARFDGMETAEMTVFMSLADILLFAEHITDFCRLCASCAARCLEWKKTGQLSIKADAAVLMTAPTFSWECAKLPDRNFFFSRIFLSVPPRFEKVPG